MLLPDNLHPENSIYFNATFILKALELDSEIDTLDLFQKTNELKVLSFPTFVLCLDWLFLLNIIVISNGEVKLCS